MAKEGKGSKQNFEVRKNETLSFDERCELVRQTRLTPRMTYEERLEMQRKRYGL